MHFNQIDVCVHAFIYIYIGYKEATLQCVMIC